MLSLELLNELKQILKEDFGIELDQDELKQYADVWIKYGELLAKIELQEIKTKKQYGT